MSALTVRLAPLQEIEIARELERLFNLQDRPLSQDKKDMIVAELSNTGYPFRAIITGIRDLVDKDLKQIKFGAIKEAARAHFQFQDAHGECRICGRGGFVTMISKDQYAVAYPCTCQRGKETAEAQRLVPWNGRRSMASVKFGMMALIHPDPKTAGIEEMSDQEYAATAMGNQTAGESSWVD